LAWKLDIFIQLPGFCVRGMHIFYKVKVVNREGSSNS